MKLAPMRPGYRFVTLFVMILARIFFGLKVYGRENVPLDGRILFVCNHLSQLDPPIVGSLIPREVGIAAKIQLFKGIIGKLIAYLNSIPVKREGSDKEAIKAMVKRLREDKSVMIFPEGTRTLDPDGAKAKAGVGMIAMMGKADIVPIRIDGSHLFPKNLFKPGGITVRFGDVIKLDEILDDSVDKKEAYKKIAEALMDRVHEMK